MRSAYSLPLPLFFTLESARRETTRVALGDEQGLGHRPPREAERRGGVDRPAMPREKRFSGVDSRHGIDVARDRAYPREALRHEAEREGEGLGIERGRALRRGEAACGASLDALVTMDGEVEAAFVRRDAG